MKTNDFICSCFGIDGEVIDEICDNFDIDFSDDDVLEAFNNAPYDDRWGVGKSLLLMLFGKIMDMYSGILDEEKFDYDFTSPSFPSMYYDDVEFSSKEELDNIANSINP